MPATPTVTDFQPARYTPKIWGQMPPRIKVLYVTTLHRTGGWLAEAFASDSACEIHLGEAIGVADGLARLREQVFDAVLVSHEPDVLDALDFVEGLRAAGNDEPMIILGREPSADLSPLAYEVGADAYCCVAETTTRSLLWTFARAIERTQLLRDHRHLLQAEQQRLAHEHHEAERLIAEQWALIAELEQLRNGAAKGEVGERGRAGDDSSASDESPPPAVSPCTSRLERSAKSGPCDLPPRLIAHYRELLRAHVVMGAGNLADEMTALANLLVESGVSARRTMQLHVEVLEELVASLGNRSARHVMTRADLLVLEVMAHLADGYRRRYDEQKCSSGVVDS
jgi:hypothetical protein